MGTSNEEMERLRTLAKLMVEQIAPEKTELLLTTGEEFDAPALDLARTFVRCTGSQKGAFIALAKAFDPDAWKNFS